MRRLLKLGALFLILATACLVFCLFLSKRKEGLELVLGTSEVNLDSSSRGNTGQAISRSSFLEEYGSEDRKTADDLEAVYALLTDCRLIFKNFASFYLPDNQAITSFLSGKNPEKLIWIPQSHFAVSAEGELLDRFGTPLFFHRISGLNFEIHAAGKDLVMWTSDDVIYPSHRWGKASE